ANQLTIPVSGNAAQVERAFSLQLARVVTLSGRVAYANVQAPALPANIAPYVQGVVGLNNATPPSYVGSLTKPRSISGRSLGASPHSRPHVATHGGPQPCSQAQALQTPNGGVAGLTADETATGYQFPSLYGA